MNEGIEAGPGATFGRRIQSRRRELRLTQRHMARDVGIDFTYLSKLENDRGDPPGEETVRTLARLLHDDPDELLALAGWLPAALRRRASESRDFAMLLRKLPNLPPDKLAEVYKVVDVQ